MSRSWKRSLLHPLQYAGAMLLVICGASSVHAQGQLSQKSAESAVYGPVDNEHPPAPTETSKQVNIFDLDDFSREQASIRRDRKRLDVMEVTYQLLNIGDAITTIDLTRRPGVREGNPILGSHPSTGAVIGVKSAMAVLHLLTYRKMRNHNVRSGLKFEAISILIQGSITGANMRFYF